VRLVSKDAYVSVRGTRQRYLGDVGGGPPLVFVDLDADQFDAIRAIPRSLTVNPRLTVLVRFAERAERVEEEVRLLKAITAKDLGWRHMVSMRVLHQPLGAPPVALDESGDEDADSIRLVARARAVELEALLHFGHAIWQPRDFHYRLVTGRHSGTFIKLGDAVRSPRDATVLASWLLEHVDEDTGLVIDTGTLTPIAQAVELMALREGKRLRPTLVLDALPRGERSVWATLDEAGLDDDRILVVIGVSSSGSLRDRVLSALNAKGTSLRDPRVIVMVSRVAPPAAPQGYAEWTPLPCGEALLPSDDYDELGCLLCRNATRARLVPINPFTLDAMGLDQLRPTVPDLKDPGQNRVFWEAANRQDAVSVERAATDAVQRNRVQGLPMGIKFEMHKIIRDDKLRRQLKQRIGEAQRKENGLRNDADLVLVPKHEFDDDDTKSLWQEIGSTLAAQGTPMTGFPTDEAFSADLVSAVKAVSHILVFTLGTVTGTSLQHALVEVQTARTGTDADFDLQGLVVHARPATHAELNSIRNSYGVDREDRAQLHMAWTSVLPDRSPLREEQRYLQRINLDEEDLDLPKDARTFIQERILLGGRTLQAAMDAAKAAAEGRPEPQLLWGSRSDLQLTPNSIYGQGLGPVATYAAVASAMAAARKRRTNIPEFVVFEVGRLVRSYYDPIILCCFLRWMRPHEAFWGWTDAEATATAGLILNRSDPSDRLILVPEMLLAGAQGKLSEEALDVVMPVANEMLNEETCEPAHPALRTGIALIKAVKRDEDLAPPVQGTAPVPPSGAGF
jgi:hypothetical protein